MKKFTFTCELQKEKQKENYKHWNTIIIIVAENKQKAIEKLSNSKYSDIQYYSSDFKEENLNTYNEIENAIRQERETLNSLKKNQIESLGCIIALVGANLGKQQVNMSGGKMKEFSYTQIIQNKDIQFLLNYK